MTNKHEIGLALALSHSVHHLLAQFFRSTTSTSAGCMRETPWRAKKARKRDLLSLLIQ